jgi:hypothetical protein
LKPVLDEFGGRSGWPTIIFSRGENYDEADLCVQYSLNRQGV